MRLSKVVNYRLSKLSENKNTNNYEKKPSIFGNSDIYNQRNSKLSSRIERSRIDKTKTIKTYSDYNQKNSQSGHTSYAELKIDYKGIEERIKHAILEMKNNCISEIKGQSCDDLEVFSSMKMKEDLKEEIKGSIVGNPNNAATDNKRKKYRKSITGVDLKNNIKKIKNNLKNKENNSKKNNNEKKKAMMLSVNERDVNLSNSSISKSSKVRKIKFNEKFRIYRKGGVIEDSFKETESDDENYDVDRFLINPETPFFFIYDAIILIASLYSLIFIPFEILTNLHYNYNNPIKNYINFFLDALFIIDLIFFLIY